jgi:cytosine/adenosine deaminase-related metal-dependent hydrolase
LADESEAGCTGSSLAGVGQRSGSMPKPGGDDDCGRRAFLTRRRDNTGYGGRRRCDDEQIRRLGQLMDCLDGSEPFDLLIMRIDEADRSFEGRISSKEIEEIRAENAVFQLLTECDTHVAVSTFESEKIALAIARSVSSVGACSAANRFPQVRDGSYGKVR